MTAMRRYSPPGSIARSPVPAGHAGPIAGDAGRVMERRGAKRGLEAAGGQPRAVEPGQDGAGVDAAVGHHAGVGALEQPRVKPLEHLVAEARAGAAPLTADR